MGVEQATQGLENGEVRSYFQKGIKKLFSAALFCRGCSYSSFFFFFFSHFTAILWLVLVFLCVAI